MSLHAEAYADRKRTLSSIVLTRLLSTVWQARPQRRRGAPPAASGRRCGACTRMKIRLQTRLMLRSGRYWCRKRLCCTED